MKNIAIYYRVSTDRQETLAQKQAMALWLDREQIKNPYLSWKIYEDIGCSGKNMNRPAFINMRTDAAANRFDTIVCYKLDRISRRTSECLNFLTWLEQLGIGFVAIEDSLLDLRPSNPLRYVILAMISVFGEIEHKAIVERVKSGLQAAKARGVKLGRPNKIDALRSDILTMREKGCTMREIASKLGISPAAVHRVIKDQNVSV